VVLRIVDLFMRVQPAELAVTTMRPVVRQYGSATTRSVVLPFSEQSAIAAGED
jgi:hypothetical protein